jgi:hypothetical protein
MEPGYLAGAWGIPRAFGVRSALQFSTVQSAVTRQRTIAEPDTQIIYLVPLAQAQETKRIEPIDYKFSTAYLDLVCLLFIRK